MRRLCSVENRYYSGSYCSNVRVIWIGSAGRALLFELVSSVAVSRKTLTLYSFRRDFALFQSYSLLFLQMNMSIGLPLCVDHLFFSTHKHAKRKSTLSLKDGQQCLIKCCCCRERSTAELTKLVVARKGCQVPTANVAATLPRFLFDAALSTWKSFTVLLT